MYAGSITFMTLSSQNETSNKYERLLDGEASLEEQNGKWLNQLLKKKKGKKGKHNLKKNKYNWWEPNWVKL